MRLPTQLSTHDKVPDDWQRGLQERLVGLSVRFQPYAVDSNYTFTDRDEIDSLQVDATADNITITLPSPTGNRRRRVIKTDASANTVTITAGTNLINGVTSHILSVRYGNITVEPTGTSWLIVGWNTQVIITGGSIDGTPIGATTPGSGAFTTLSATQQIDSGVDIKFSSNLGYGLLSANDTRVLAVTNTLLTVGAQLRVNNLAGIGTRAVVVDANGNLSAP